MNPATGTFSHGYCCVKPPAHSRSPSTNKLPVAARRYLERIEEISGVPVHLISTSPDRNHTIMRQHPFATLTS